MQAKEGFYEFYPVTSRASTRFQLQAHPFEETHLLESSQVVDITIKNNTIYVISRSNQNIISSTPTPTVRDFQDLYRDLPPEVQRIVGDVDWPAPHALLEIVESVRNGTA